ncbi:MAG: hypothetical protein Q9201_006425 [Fulgogasparrea decipioides]
MESTARASISIAYKYTGRCLLLGYGPNESKSIARFYWKDQILQPGDPQARPQATSIPHSTPSSLREVPIRLLAVTARFLFAAKDYQWYLLNYNSKYDADSTVCNCIKQQCSVARWTIQSGTTKESGTTFLRAVQKQKSSGPAAANRTLSMSDGTGSMEYPQGAEIDGLDSRNNSMLRPDGEEGESETDQVAQSLGVLKVFDNKSLYFGEAHWAAILKDISEVKNFFAEHKKQLDEQAQRVQASKTEESFPQGPTFLFDGTNAPEFPELLNSLPKRIITDKLVARFFNTFDPTIRE